MIPVKDRLVDVDNIPGEEISFGIGDPRWVMKTQADLYSDITTAIIREYSTNAYDANVMADNPAPIKVTLPSAMNQFFIVEDEGVGMDINLFRKVYTQFGVSDKRDSNKTNGMLGYGSKSGVAYTDQFTVTSIKDGIKIHGIIKRKPDWEIVLKIVSTVKTDEPNGTRIEIPVHNISEFVQKANDFYKFWLPGRVLVNGREPVHHVGKKIADGLYHAPDGTYGQSHIVMGNVPYRINNPSALFSDLDIDSINFVAYVDTIEQEDGSEEAAVEFTPSREDLKYTDHTKRTLHRVMRDFQDKILATAEQEVADAESHYDAFVIWSKWSELLGSDLFSELEYKGDKFRSNFEIRGTRYSPYGYRGTQTRQIKDWKIDALYKTVVITNFNLTLTSRHKHQVKEYAKQQDWQGITYFIFTGSSADDIDSPWVTKDKFVDFETVKEATKNVKPRVVNNNPNAGRIPGSWDYHTASGTETEKPIPPNMKNYYYISVRQNNRISVMAALKFAGDADSAVIVVPENRRAKLLRENPKIKRFEEWISSNVVKDESSLLTSDAKAVLNLHWQDRNLVSSLDVTKVDDPYFATLVEVIKDEHNLLKPMRDNERLASLLGMQYQVVKYRGNSRPTLMDKYPLLAASICDHTYIYLNAVYAAESENDE